MKVETLSKETAVEVNGGYAPTKPLISSDRDGNITINENTDFTKCY